MYDVAIVGGALTGSSAAYHLLRKNPELRVAVIEKDPSYEWSASARSNAMVRVVFSQPENLLMSRYGQSFYGNFDELMEIEGHRPVLDYPRGGLLIIANTDAQREDVHVNTDFQRSMQCEVEILTPEEIHSRWPSINCDDIHCASYSADAGWIDPHGALSGLRKKARHLGAEYLHGEVLSFDVNRHRIDKVWLSDDTQLEADFVINAAGAWAGGLCKTLGFEIPVVPLPRMVYYFETPQTVEELPYIRDGLGIGFRREGKGFISGITDMDIAGEFCFDVNHDWFDERVWPGLANRVQQFEQLRVQNAWVGHYAQSLFDGNMLIGPSPEGPDNFLIATGFSGHGLQHAPAVGRALSELILDGSYQSIDLTRLNCDRVQLNRPYPERGWKA